MPAPAGSAFTASRYFATLSFFTRRLLRMLPAPRQAPSGPRKARIGAGNVSAATGFSKIFSHGAGTFTASCWLASTSVSPSLVAETAAGATGPSWRTVKVAVAFGGRAATKLRVVPATCAGTGLPSASNTRGEAPDAIV